MHVPQSSIPAAGLLLVVAGPAAAQMPKHPVAAANVRASHQYERQLRSEPGFRARRIAEECDPIADRELHAQCVASFGDKH